MRAPFAIHSETVDIILATGYNKYFVESVCKVAPNDCIIAGSGLNYRRQDGRGKFILTIQITFFETRSIKIDSVGIII